MADVENIGSWLLVCHKTRLF